MQVKDIIIPIAIALVFFVVGFCTSRCTTKPEIKTEYITLPPIHDTIDSIQVKWKSLPVDPIDTSALIEFLYYSGELDYLVKTDTEYLKVDTSAIIKEFITKNYYSIELFNIDTLGKCSIDALVQFNRLDSLSYTYVPVQKVVTEVRRPAVNFLVSAGAGVGTKDRKANTGLVDLGAGIVIKDHYMLQYMFQWQFDNQMNHNIIIGYKF